MLSKNVRCKSCSVQVDHLGLGQESEREPKNYAGTPHSLFDRFDAWRMADSYGVARRSAPNVTTRLPSVEHHRKWPAIGDYNYDDDYVEVEEGVNDEDYDFDDDDNVDDDGDGFDFKGGGAQEKEAGRESNPGTQTPPDDHEEPAKLEPKEAALDKIGEELEGTKDSTNPGVRLALPSVLLLMLAAYWYRGRRHTNRRCPSFALPCALFGFATVFLTYHASVLSDERQR